MTGAHDTRRAENGAPTVVALSGGADSSALLIALAAGGAAVRRRLLAVHVIHDMRSRREAMADRDRCQTLCRLLGIELLVREISVHTVSAPTLDDESLGQIRLASDLHENNLEALARRRRYAALLEAASERNFSYVATGHQLDDQLETMLMRLLRGAGPRGLGGMPTSRILGKLANHSDDNRCDVRLVRPLLAGAASHDDCMRICNDAGWEWAEDATNQDPSRLRNAIRLKVAPVLQALRKDAARSAARSSELLQQADRVIRRKAAAIIRSAQRQCKATQNTDTGPHPRISVQVLDRKTLRKAERIVLGAALRQLLCSQQDRGSTLSAHRDRLTRAAIDPIVSAIKDRSTDPRRFELAGAEIFVRAHSIEIRKSYGSLSE